jgi:hypothetical protein
MYGVCKPFFAFPLAQAAVKDSVTQSRFFQMVFAETIVGLDDSHRAVLPQPGSKTAGWIIGHLCVTGDFGRKLCGRTPLCPKEWRAKFNPGSEPSTNPADYPPMTELIARFREVYSDLCDAALTADPATLQGDNPFVPARPLYPTAGSFVPHLLAGHLAYHTGQLVGWRAAAGLGRIRDIVAG